MSRLGRLDAHAVPRLAAAARRGSAVLAGWIHPASWRSTAGAPPRAGGRAGRTASHPAPTWVVATTLAVAVAALASAAVLRAGLPGPARAPDTAGVALTAGPDVGIGPEPGTPVAAYLAARRTALSERLQSGPGPVGVALVDLADYLTPEAVAGLIRGKLTLVSATVRVRPDGVPAFTATAAVRRLPQDLRAVLAGQAEALRQTAAGLLAQADPAAVPSPGDQPPALHVRDDARAAAAQADLLAGPCRCVAAVLVAGTVAALAALGRDPGVVRLVDLAPPGPGPRPSAVRPLFPEDTVTAGAL